MVYWLKIKLRQYNVEVSCAATVLDSAVCSNAGGGNTPSPKSMRLKKGMGISRRRVNGIRRRGYDEREKT